VGFVSRHIERDRILPLHREVLLKNALTDLKADPSVLAIYLNGSLAKGNSDLYSDIDLHTIVPVEKKAEFIKEKRNRAKKWGEVLFFEDFNPRSPVVVTHYNCFVKVDSWYHSPEEVTPSIWLKGLEVLYDPHQILCDAFEESSKLVYKPSSEEVAFWRGKLLAFFHETYRAVMRDELYYALSNLDRIRWLIASGWYMEMEKHLESSYGIWSKIEGKRSKLSDKQLLILKSWDCPRDSEAIMKTMVSMVPEIIRLNRHLCKKVGMAANEDHIRKVIEMTY
jgi:predicted nucleotidyltransferase